MCVLYTHIIPAMSCDLHSLWLTNDYILSCFGSCICIYTPYVIFYRIRSFSVTVITLSLSVTDIICSILGSFVCIIVERGMHRTMPTYSILTHTHTRLPLSHNFKTKNIVAVEKPTVTHTQARTRTRIAFVECPSVCCFYVVYVVHILYCIGHSIIFNVFSFCCWPTITLNRTFFFISNARLATPLVYHTFFFLLRS